MTPAERAKAEHHRRIRAREAKVSSRYTPPVCPNISDHCPDQPDNYTSWLQWAQAKNVTHKQFRCAGCELMEIWVPR